MEKYKYKYKKVIGILTFLAILAIGMVIISYYEDWDLIAYIFGNIAIAIITGLVIESIGSIKAKEYNKISEYRHELNTMKKSIIQYRENIKKISRNRRTYNFYQDAYKIMTEINNLNEQIEYIYENHSKRSLQRRFLEKQKIDIDYKKEECEEIIEDISNELDKRTIKKKMMKYNSKFSKLLYAINRELEIKI